MADADLNFTVMRFAEILLIQAEALNELNRSADALIPLNRVRKRARESYLYDQNLAGYGTIPNGLLPDVTTTDQVQLRVAIRHERRVELGFECQRYFDIIRYGETYANNAFINKSNLIAYEKLSYLSLRIKRASQNKPIFHTIYNNEYLYQLNKEETRLPVSELRAKRILIITAIGNPEALRKAIYKQNPARIELLFTRIITCIKKAILKRFLENLKDLIMS